MDETLRQVAERVAAAQRLAERVATLSATATSPDRMVTVTVGPGGALTGLDISDRAMRLRGRDLGRRIVETIAQATADLEATLDQEIAAIPGAPAHLSAVLSGRLPAAPDLESVTPDSW